MTPQQNPFANAEEARKYMELDGGHHVKNYAIIPTVMNMLGDVHGKRILDVGCGYGLVSEALADKGAEVFGVDPSKEMIKLAKQSRGNVENLFYINISAEDLAKIEGRPFDEAISILVLNYVDSKRGLEKFFSGVFGHLKQGGRFISFQNQMAEFGFKGGRVNTDRVYEKISSIKASGYAPRFRFTRTVGDRNVSCKLTDWSFADYEEAARGAGFRRIQRRETMVSLNGINHLPSEYWTNYVETNIFQGFEATK